MFTCTGTHQGRCTCPGLEGSLPHKQAKSRKSPSILPGKRNKINITTLFYEHFNLAGALVRLLTGAMDTTKQPNTILTARF